MTVGLTGFTAAQINTATATTTFSFTSTDQPLYVRCAAWPNGFTITGVTFNGAALTLVADSGLSAAGDRCFVWRLTNPDVGTFNVVVTPSVIGCAGSASAVNTAGQLLSDPEETVVAEVNASATTTGTSAVTAGADDRTIWCVSADSGTSNMTPAATGGAPTEEYDAANNGEWGHHAKVFGAVTDISSTWGGAASVSAIAGVVLKGDPAYVAPVVFQTAGTPGGTTTGSVSVAWPAGHEAGDIGLLFVERAGGSATPTLLTDSGFVEVPGALQSTGTGTAGTKIDVFWCRATSGAMANPAVVGSADHQWCVIVTFRGCVPTGDPWDVVGGGVKASADTTVTVPGVTTTVPDTLIVVGCARDNDSSAAAFSAQANGNLTGIAEHFDAGITAGGGGGLGVWSGTMAAAGATGDFTATVTSSINAFATIALRPEPAAAAGPELYGRPAGLRGQNQMRQLLAQ